MHRHNDAMLLKLPNRGLYKVVQINTTLEKQLWQQDAAFILTQQ